MITLARTLLRWGFVMGAIVVATIPRSASAQVEMTQDFTPVTPPREPADLPPRAAEPARAAVPSPERTESYWYGWQTLTADGASLAMLFTGTETGVSGLGLLGFGGLFIASPIVHGANGRVGPAFASLGLRVAMTFVGGVIGYSAAASCSASERNGAFGCRFDGWGEAIVGSFIGLGGAVALDAAWLAHGQREVAAPRESGMPRVTSLAPSFDPRTRTAAVGLGGRF